MNSTALLQAHDRMLRRRRWLLLLMLALVALLLALDLTTGPSGLGLARLLAAATGAEPLSAGEHAILWSLRLPVGALAIAVGANLALAGAEMQTILANPLASPFTLGVSAAASLGAASVIVLGLALPWAPEAFSVTASAFIFALGATAILQLAASARRGGPGFIVMFGIALAFSFNALLALVQFAASPDALQQLTFWSMGSLARADWQGVALATAAFLLVAPFSWRDAWRLTTLRMGDDRAASAGVNVPLLRFMALLRISVLAATAVSLAGVIGFVGLVAPHIARLLVGENHRLFLPASVLAGAAMMSAASIASKTLIPGVLLPVGIVTSLVGLPVFLALIVRRGAML